MKSGGYFAYLLDPGDNVISSEIVHKDYEHLKRHSYRLKTLPGKIYFLKHRSASAVIHYYEFEPVDKERALKEIKECRLLIQDAHQTKKLN